MSELTKEDIWSMASIKYQREARSQWLEERFLIGEMEARDVITEYMSIIDGGHDEWFEEMMWDVVDNYPEYFVIADDLFMINEDYQDEA